MSSTVSPLPVKADQVSPASLEDLSARVKKLEETLAKQRARKNKVALICFSGTIDHTIASLYIAQAALAMGMEVTMFFTFWGLSLLKDRNKRRKPKGIIETMLKFMLHKGVRKFDGVPFVHPRGTKLSQMHMGGLGSTMIKARMKGTKIQDLEEGFAQVQQLGAKFFGCETTMTLMGLQKEDFIDYPNLGICGAATFVANSVDNALTLFI